VKLYRSAVLDGCYFVAAKSILIYVRCGMKRLRAISAVLVSASLVSCASSMGLTQAAKTERDGMTPRQAEQLLAKYAGPDNGHGGVCLLGARALTGLDGTRPISVSGSVISFSGNFTSLAGARATGNAAGGTGAVEVGYQVSAGSASLDMRKLKLIRVRDSNPMLLGFCPKFKPGYLVGLKSDPELPDHTELLINAESPADLDAILAMLTYFAPQVRVVSGMGL
jgi:hypothetical protein